MKKLIFMLTLFFLSFILVFGSSHPINESDVPILTYYIIEKDKNGNNKAVRDDRPITHACEPDSCFREESRASYLASLGVQTNSEYEQLKLDYLHNYENSRNSYNLILDKEPDCSSSNCKVLKSHFEESEDILIKISKEEGASQVLGDMSQKQREEFLEIYNDDKCGGSWLSIICKTFNSQTQTQLYELDYLESIENLNPDDENYEELLLTNMKNLLPQGFASELDGCDNEVTKCIEGLKEKKCLDNPTCENNVDNALAILEIADSKKQVQTNIIFDVLSIVNDADNSALKAARLFGFEDKFSLVDENSIFGQEGFSNICLAKIDGYIDETRSDNGGITRYEFTNTSVEREIVVRYDLRAQRTLITPDNNVAITYSYFIRAPDSDIDYLIALFYKQNGEIRKIALTELLTLEGAQSTSNFDNVNVPLNDTEGIDADSFRIKFRANFAGTTNRFTQFEAPVILIEEGDEYREEVPVLNLGNSNGNDVARTQEEDEDFDSEDMLDLMGD